MSSENYYSTVTGHRRSHRKPGHKHSITDNTSPAYHSRGIISVTQPSNNQAVAAPGGHPDTGYVHIPATARQENQIRFAQEQQAHRNAFASHFYDIEWKTRNIKPWQWGVAAGAVTFIAGIGFVEGVAVGAVRGLSLLGARLAGALGAAGAVLSKIPPGKNREIMDKAIQLGRQLPTFMDKVGALKEAVQTVMCVQNIIMKVDFINQIAYGGKGGYGIAVIADITYVVRIENEQIVEILGKFR